MVEGGEGLEEPHGAVDAGVCDARWYVTVYEKIHVDALRKNT